jgi:predicted acyltransferase
MNKVQQDNSQKHKPIKERILSLDQFRGFAIFGMILVNYLGHFDVIHETFKHPRFGMTFANAIAPYFLFAVGMGFRMSLQRRIAKFGRSKAYIHAIKRYIILILIGIVVYGPDPVCDMWDALVDIGFGGLVALPFILSNKTIRISMAVVFLIFHQLLFALTPYGEWTMANSIDGGPLGIFPWSTILIFGTIVMDYLMELPRNKFIRNSLILGVILMIVGYALSLLEPKAIWEFSQRSMTMAYPLFSSGLSIVTFVAFYFVNDIKKIELPQLTILGMNPLAIYILQQVLLELYGSRLPRESTLTAALAGFVVIYGICYVVALYLWRNKYIIRI